MNCESIDTSFTKLKLNEKLEVYIEEIDNLDEKMIVIQQKEEIINKLMNGKFQDLGGLTAMRGFIYQYYVAIFHMVSMINPTQNITYHSVVLEYFDDITLIGNNYIRFIQVKTVRSAEGKKHIPSNFTTRKSKKTKNEPINIKHFNSWIEKNILNYDTFLSKKNEFGLENNLIPQFEIVTNTPFDSLEELSDYTSNTEYHIKTEISDNDKLKKPIKKPIDNYNFEDFSEENIDFYLKKVYINKFASIDYLEKEIKNLIRDVVDSNDFLTSSKIDYVFEKLLVLVIHRSHEDNEKIIDKKELIFTNLEIKKIVDKHIEESYELASIDVLKHSAISMMNSIFKELELEFERDFEKGTLQDELLEALENINIKFNENTQKDLSYSINILNKVYKGHNKTSSWNFTDSDLTSDTKESIRLLIYFLVFYEENAEIHDEASMMYHEGYSKSYIDDPSVIEKMLFTIYHARNRKTVEESKAKIKFNISKCDVSKTINQDIYCLIAGAEEDYEDEDDSFIDHNITENSSKNYNIVNVALNILFVESKTVKSIFQKIKRNKISLNSFKDLEGLRLWINKLNSSVQK